VGVIAQKEEIILTFGTGEHEKPLHSIQMLLRVWLADKESIWPAASHIWFWASMHYA
jgi:hypothetical protein